jgi:hypothetical protein
MHTRIAEWYRTSSIDAGAEVLASRSAALEELAPKLDSALGLDLVRFWFGRPIAQDEHLAIVSQAVVTADPTFVPKDSLYELKALAAMTAAIVVETESSTADSIAQAIVCRSLDGRILPECLAGLIAEARQYLAQRAVTVRKVPLLAPAKFPTKEALGKRVQAIQAAVDQNSVPALGEPLIAHLTALNTELREILAVLYRGLSETTASQRLLAEESNIFWWCYTAYSADLDIRLLDLEYPIACLVAAKELASLTAVTPGPRSARSYVSMAVNKGRTKKETSADVGLAATINALDPELRNAWRNLYPADELGELTPVLVAIGKSTETDDPDHWGSAFKKATAIEPELALPPIDLGCQLYREMVLVKSIASVVRQN